MEFSDFGKIARFSREIVITEKIDGTNGQIFIDEDGNFAVGSRNRWITPENDNYGFAKWAYENKECLMQLGPGRHFGEWWGLGIQAGYGMDKKVFSLFNTSRWLEQRPDCCSVVPVLYAGVFSASCVEDAILKLKENGSVAAPGFMKPEGVIVYHTAANVYFKKTIEKDQEHKTFKGNK
jgi:hypothetical protein